MYKAVPRVVLEDAVVEGMVAEGVGQDRRYNLRFTPAEGEIPGSAVQLRSVVNLKR